ncbi:MAG: anti-sigma-I factor RsgI family protein [Bacillota bacterium]
MRLQKGICIELDGDHSVYMLADGRFVNGRPKEGTAVGEEAYFECLQNEKTARHRLKPLALPIIAAVAIMFLAFSTWMLPAEEAYGYVQIESNPGIELGVDDEWRVISVRELNEDGKQLIGRLADWENQSLEDILKKVFALSIDEETEHVTITTVQGEEDTEATINVEQIALATLFAGSNRNLHLHLKEANKKQWRKAKRQQVPVAQFVDNDRTFTSPHKQNNDVQPAQNEDSRLDKVEQNKAGSEAVPNLTENSPAPKVEADKNSVSPSKESEPETSPAPADKGKPDAPKAPSIKEPEKAPKPPAAKKEPSKPKEPSAGKSEKPDSTKGNNSTPEKTNPEKPSGKQTNPAQKNNLESKVEKDKIMEKPKGNEASKENSGVQGKSNAIQPGKNSTQKLNPGNSKTETGKDSKEKNTPVSNKENGNGKAPDTGGKSGNGRE